MRPALQTQSVLYELSMAVFIVSHATDNGNAEQLRAPRDLWMPTLQ